MFVKRLKPRRKIRSRPYIPETLRLESEDAQDVYEDTFDVAPAALQRLSEILPNILKEPEIRKIEELVDQALDKGHEEMRNKLEELNALTANNGVSLTVKWSNPFENNVHVTSRRCTRYFDVLRTLDQVLSQLKKLNFAGVLDDATQRKAIKENKKAVRRLAYRLRELVPRAAKAGHRRGKAPETKEALAEADAFVNGLPGAEPVPPLPPESLIPNDTRRPPAPAATPAVSIAAVPPADGHNGAAQATLDAKGNIKTPAKPQKAKGKQAKKPSSPTKRAATKSDGKRAAAG